MSDTPARHGRIVLPWIASPGEQAFNIAPIKCVLALEEACGAGIAKILDRLHKGEWRYYDVRETIRLGLIGAGMPDLEALSLVKKHVDQPPDDGGWMVFALIASRIIEAAVVGVPGDPVGKEPAEATHSNGSAPPSSTEPAAL